MAELIHRKTGGVFVIAATPFAEDGALDLDSTDRLVDYYLDTGVDGLTVLGVMGEAPKLTSEESATFATHILRRVSGRVPVIVGVTGAGLDNMARPTFGERARAKKNAHFLFPVYLDKLLYIPLCLKMFFITDINFNIWDFRNHIQN